MKKILFVSHDANRAGAQILLLRFLKKLSQRTDFQFHVLLRKGGPLSEEFENLAPTFWMHLPAGRSQRAFKRLLGQSALALPAALLRERYDLIVSNTVTNGDLLEILRGLGGPVVTYAHELEIGISQYTSSEAFAHTLQYSDFFMTCSRVQRERYIANYALDPARIDYLPSLLPDSPQETARIRDAAPRLRLPLNLPSDALLVGCMGSLDWRKGIDVFVQLAHHLPETINGRPVRLVWVGGSHSQTEYKIIAEDVRRLGWASRFLFIENQPNPLEYMACFDVFALPSREEPYPLVVLEAALLEKPVVCFDGAGGAREVVETDAGFVCDYLDAEAMAGAISHLLHDQPLRQRMGRVARQKVLERHADERAMGVFVELLQKYSAVSEPVVLPE